MTENNAVEVCGTSEVQTYRIVTIRAGGRKNPRPKIKAKSADHAMSLFALSITDERGQLVRGSSGLLDELHMEGGAIYKAMLDD